jgi:hypothetical protein
MKKIETFKKLVAVASSFAKASGDRLPGSVKYIAALWVGLLLLLAAMPALADSQGYPSTFGTLTNLPATLPASGVSGPYTNYIPLRSFSGLGLGATFQGSNLVTAPVTEYIWQSIDGTNPANTAPFATWVIPQNGTNVVLAATNWSNLQLKGFAGVFITVSNGSANSVLNLNETLTQTNGTSPNGTNYQGGDLFNRPNQ